MSSATSSGIQTPLVLLNVVVREWYEHLHGPLQPLSGQLHRRLAEYALDRMTAETRDALAGESAAAALADSFSSRFSLFDDTDVETIDALAA
jgi:ATP-dependent helicase/nuclease subunit B